MKIVLYGMPCAGKTTLMEKVKGAKILYGSKTLQKIAGRRFSELSEDEKRNVRIKYTEYVNSMTDDLVISDGHYSFLEDVVFTENDGDLYDVFMYVYCSASTLLKRYACSEKNKKYANCPGVLIEEWQNFEIESLRRECHKRNKDFYVISDNETSDCKFFEFLNRVKDGFSSYRLAEDISRKIQEIYPAPCDLNILDGDKTIVKQDTFRYCLGGKTTVFDGDFYSGYQSFLFEDEIKKVTYTSEVDVSQVEVNPLLSDVVEAGNYVVISSGISELWSKVARVKGIQNVFASPVISADTKFFVVKILKAKGYAINAFGDSKNDLYMLHEADYGTLVITDKVSRSLNKACIGSIRLRYDKTPFFLNEETNAEVESDIAICKSSSGINGNLLASAHHRLGLKLGEIMSKSYPNVSTALMILERGGRFFGDGVYASFGGILYAVKPTADSPLPAIKESRIVLIDSVINSGKSIERIVAELKRQNPDIDIVIATNVIQEKALALFKDYKVFAVRKSLNSFVGENTAKQVGGKGPDTADRLFNHIQKRFKF